MRSWDVPSASISGGVAAITHVNAGLSFGESLGKFQISRCVVNRVRWCEENDGFNFEIIQIRSERGNVAETFVYCLISVEAFAFTDISKSDVDRKREMFDRFRLTRSSKNRRLCGTASEIFCEFSTPFDFFLIG